MKRDTTSQEFFEQKYREDADPWNFRLSAYEQSRYDATLRALGQGPYMRAFEPGCSIGLLTARLAEICGHVEAIDISPTAAEQARANCRNLSNVTIVTGALPDAIPSGRFDLIVLSEIGYYFTESQLRELSRELFGRLRTPSTLIATHWLGESEDHILSGDRVHEILGSSDGLTLTHSERAPGYRLDRWDRS